MAIRIEDYSPAHRESARRFLASLAPGRPDGYYAWRLEGCPRMRTLLGLDGEQCGALVTSIAKPYRIHGEATECLELFDWSAIPEYRRRGVGLLLLRRLMDEGRPMIVVGGSDDTRNLLPRLRWHRIADAKVFALPRRGSYVREKLAARRARFPVLAGALFSAGGGLWFHPPRTRGREWSAQVHTAFDPRLLALYDARPVHQLVALPAADVFAWMASFPRAGAYLHCQLFERGVLAGWGLARLFLAGEQLRGEIVDVFCAAVTEDAYALAIAAMSRVLAGFEVDAIVASATCPAVVAALGRCRFIVGAHHPVHLFWPRPSPPPGPPCHVMGTTADNPILPFPPVRA